MLTSDRTKWSRREGEVGAGAETGGEEGETGAETGTGRGGESAVETGEGDTDQFILPTNTDILSPPQPILHHTNRNIHLMIWCEARTIIISFIFSKMFNINKKITLKIE